MRQTEFTMNNLIKPLENLVCQSYNLEGKSHADKVIFLACLSDMHDALNKAMWHGNTADVDYVVHVNGKWVKGSSSFVVVPPGIENDFTACCDFNEVSHIECNDELATQFAIKNIRQIHIDRA